MNTFHSLIPLEKELTKAFFGREVEDRNSWQPVVNVYESDENYRIELEVPGLNREDIQIRYEDELLIVEGERKAPEITEGLKTWRQERRFGKFSRSFRLVKDVDTDTIGAELRDGLLNLTLLKSEKSKARLIEIS